MIVSRSSLVSPGPRGSSSIVRSISASRLSRLDLADLRPASAVKVRASRGMI